jgi:hypothetical protein
MPAGDYDLSLAILDPNTGKPAVKLAIGGMGEDRWYSLGKLTVH